jgi:hypothetical protein
MIEVAVPGYSEIFGPSSDSYAQLMNGVDRKTSILYCLSLTGELYASMACGVNQRRLMVSALIAFSDTLRQHIITQFFRLRLERNDRRNIAV